ncbi:methionine--tRNA ligase [Candidatus Woesearchaeota archaeon]|nr:methionine--tRNA ligase [Candidatus Woesearchaeota archaeon]
MPKETFYITTAIDYPNGKPHLGHAYEKIVADTLARWHRLSGEDVFFLTGTDEHGQKTERAAKAAGKKPQEFVDGNVAFFKELTKALNLSNDDFIRTTETRHTKIVQELFERLLATGDIYKGTYEGLYCTGCEAFYTEKDLVEGKCTIHKRDVEKVQEESYFFRLSKYQDRLINHIEENPDFILPKFRREEILNHIKEGLRDISVSRTSVTWGVPVKSDPKHVIYVWVDALPNYITALGYPSGAKFKKYWPADVHIVGKDINRFHTVIWPAILIALGVKPPRSVHSHGFINVGGEKLSKTTGVRVDPLELVEKYGADALRYYFLREVPAGEDGDFTEKALIERVNGDLADGVGNLLNRVSTLVHKNFDGTIPKPTAFQAVDNDLVAQANIAKDVDALMRKYEWNKAVEKIWDFVRYCNKYLSFTEPWKHQDEKERLATVLYSLVESLRIISILISPFVPALAEKVRTQLGQKEELLEDAAFRKTTKGKLTATKPVFLKLEMVQEDPFSMLNLRVAEIKDVQPHPNADKLYVLQIHLGKEHRQLVAGIKPWYKPDELKGKRVVVVSNLKPAQLRGVESQGMLLAAEKQGVVKVLDASKGEPGEQVVVEGIAPKQAQITIDDFAKITLTTKDGKAVYDGKPLKVKSGEIVVDLPDGAKIR